MGQDKLNLFQKIQAVSDEIKVISKNLTVGGSGYGYKAVADVDVIIAINKAEKKHKIVSVPVSQELVKSEMVKTLNKSGNESINYVDIIKLTLRIIDLENTSDYIEVEAYGRGLDSGDKGFGKAATYARKYALLNAYKLATGVDPDADPSKKQESKPDTTFKDMVIGYLAKDFAYANQIREHYKKTSIEELSDQQIKSIYENLTKKGKL